MHRIASLLLALSALASALEPLPLMERKVGEREHSTKAQLVPVVNSIGVKLVTIEPGSFLMGQNGLATDYKVNEHAAKFDDADWDPLSATMAPRGRKRAPHIREGPLLLCSVTDLSANARNPKGM